MTILMLILSLVYMFTISITYFKRKHIDSREIKIFSQLLLINIGGLIVEIILKICCWAITTQSIITILMTKIYLIYITWFALIMSFYVYLISTKKELDDSSNINNGLMSVGLFIGLFSSAILLVLPVDFASLYSDYCTGLAVNYVYLLCIVLIVICIIVMIRNWKNLQIKKCLPLFVFFVGMIIGAFIQKEFPEITITTVVESFVLFIMYFTIENPDVKMIQKLEVAKEQADKANSAKTDFLSSMSHEIRTPLNAIVGFSDCIMEAKDLNEAQENAKDIVNASQTLLEIVNGILDISKIEAGKIEIVNSPYDAHETFEELAILITPKMNEKGLDFSYTIAPDLPKTLYGDHANLKKVVTNLLSNACKYTEHGYVHYEVNCINTKNLSKLIISVEDSGRGIKKDSIDKLFTKFQRLDEDRNTTIEGTGLGLAITKQLVELMGGKIIVHTVYGEGSKFTVVLNQRIEAAEEKHEHHVQTTLDLYNVRILIVDDTALNLKVACKLLQRYNANQLVTCDSGFECIDRIKRGEVYDLILLDDMMPKMSGVETLQELKKIPGFRIPTVALTANAITGMKEKYLNDGFDGYLAKPIEKEQLIQVINEILGRNVTQELDFSKEEKVTQYIGGPVSPSIRGEEIPNVDDYDKAEEARRKNEIIPVEDNIEEVLGDQLELNYQEKEEASSEEKLESQPQEILPVVDIDLPTETIEKVENYDRKYLEDNGVDVNHALELLGDMDMYNMTISDFFSEVEDKWSKIVEYKETNNMPEYAILVHSLKSDCKYLGFMTLADISYQHELKSKENDEEFVNSHFSELEEEYKKVLEIARTYVEHNPVENQE